MNARDIDESTVALPPRFWWLKRLSIAAVVLLVALGGIRWWWGSVASARLQVEVDRIKAAGEPLFPEDFAHRPIADEDNAAHFLRQAYLKFSGIKSVDDADVDELQSESGMDGDGDAVQAPVIDDATYLADRTEAIALVRKARQCADVDWSVYVTSPMLMAQPMYELAWRIEDAAKRYTRLGRHAETLALIADQFTIADAVDKQPDSLTCHKIASSIRVLAVNMVQEQIGSIVIADANEDLAGSVSRAQIESLIALLLDESPAQQGAINAWMCDRAASYALGSLVAAEQMGLSTLSTGSASSAAERAVSFVVAPMFQLDTLTMIRRTDALIESIQQTNLPAAADHLAKASPVDAQTRNITNIFSNLVYPAHDAAVRTEYQCIAQRRMAAIALAMRLYEHDHGRRPAALTELSPDYIATLPLDPLASDGRTFGFKPEGVDPLPPPPSRWPSPKSSPEQLKFNRLVPVLYSVGANARDDGGEFQLNDKGGSASGRDRGPGDLVFLLDGLVKDMPERPDDPESDPYDQTNDLKDNGAEESPGETGHDDPEPEDDAGDEQQG